MARYAQFTKTERGGGNDRTIKHEYTVRCEILAEKGDFVLVDYDQDGPIWMDKQFVKIIDNEIN